MTMTQRSSFLETLGPYLRPDVEVVDHEGIPTTPIRNRTPGLDANAYYFGHPVWSAEWFKAVHRYPQFKERWHAAAGSWDDKVVVDVGCGPGNVFATVGGSPRLLIGVDVSRGALKHAVTVGYAPLLADAQEMPLVDAFADIVVLNSTIHHCDDMQKVLAESARLVKPGGILIATMIPTSPPTTSVAWANFSGTSASQSTAS